MQLTTHFTLEELIASQNASRLGIDNYPGVAQIQNLKYLAESLELVRDLLGHPIHVSSGFRSVELNANPAVGGQKTSAHMDGLAADIECHAFGTPLEICRAIAASEIPFDQIIREFDSWCHFAIPHKGLIGRRDLLTIDKAGTRQGLGD